MDNAVIQAASTKRMYHALDGLRGVAALFVVFWHLGAILSPFAVGSAYLAVDLFFLISGFVIANAYQDRLTNQALGAVRFAGLRIVRLYPLYLAGTLIGLIVAVAPLIHRAHAPGAWGDIAVLAVPALVMLPGPDVTTPALLYPLDLPAWSLFWELGGNALYGSLPQLRRGWLLPATVAGAGAALVIVVIAFGSIDGGWLWHHWWMGPIRVLFSFFLGVIGYKLYAAGRLPMVRFPLLPLFLVIAAVLYGSPGAQFRLIYDLAAVLIVFPAVVWLCVVNEPRYGLRCYTLAGLISYPVYTVHVPILLLVQLIGHHEYGYDEFNARFAAWAPWSGLAMLATLLPLSWLLAVTYDGWARRRLGRLADRFARAPGLVTPHIPPARPKPGS